jgi:hypothetical protein
MSFPISQCLKTAIACGKDTFSSPPWSQISERPSDYFDPDVLGIQYSSMIKEPSKMVKANLLAVLTHLFKRQEAESEPRFQMVVPLGLRIGRAKAAVPGASKQAARMTAPVKAPVGLVTPEATPGLSRSPTPMPWPKDSLQKPSAEGQELTTPSDGRSQSNKTDADGRLKQRLVTDPGRPPMSDSLPPRPKVRLDTGADAIIDTDPEANHDGHRDPSLSAKDRNSKRDHTGPTSLQGEVKSKIGGGLEGLTEENDGLVIPLACDSDDEREIPTEDLFQPPVNGISKPANPLQQPASVAHPTNLVQIEEGVWASSPLRKPIIAASKRVNIEFKPRQQGRSLQTLKEAAEDVILPEEELVAKVVKAKSSRGGKRGRGAKARGAKGSRSAPSTFLESEVGETSAQGSEAPPPISEKPQAKPLRRHKASAPQEVSPGLAKDRDRREVKRPKRPDVA